MHCKSFLEKKGRRYIYDSKILKWLFIIHFSKILTFFLSYLITLEASSLISQTLFYVKI